MEGWLIGLYFDRHGIETIGRISFWVALVGGIALAATAPYAIVEWLGCLLAVAAIAWAISLEFMNR